MHRPGMRVASFTLACLVALLFAAPQADARERMGARARGPPRAGRLTAR